MHLKKSKTRNGFIFKATFIDDTPAGTECLVRYGYTPSWDFVKGSQRPCVPEVYRPDEPEGSKDAAEEEQDDEKEDPKPKKGKGKHRSRSNKNKVPDNNNAIKMTDGSTITQHTAHTHCTGQGPNHKARQDA